MCFQDKPFSRYRLPHFVTNDDDNDVVTPGGRWNEAKLPSFKAKRLKEFCLKMCIHANEKKWPKWSGFILSSFQTFLPLDEATTSTVVTVIISGSDGQVGVNASGASKISQKQYRYTRCANKELIKTRGWAIEWAFSPDSHDPHKHLPYGGSKSMPFKFQPTSWRSTKILIGHILGPIGWLC